MKSILFAVAAFAALGSSLDLSNVRPVDATVQVAKSESKQARDWQVVGTQQV